MVFRKIFLAQKISWAILPMMGYQFKIKEPQLQNYVFHGIHSSYEPYNMTTLRAGGTLELWELQ